ncbi:hypothetical protein [Streptomyces sp. NBC_01264]|uniref:hypothetical protein n=1 Tax=Streptomyces sp. NBC_01264 TaxID=2903804 RepID=UPI0022537C76|nr:hypothetical protein [Streptomyces sp. NBC_01264]MCX4780335.1 hypothetical protein [Streptomyces sp. NBC_01264]
MTTSPSDEPPGPGSGPDAAPAAAGLGMLSLGGWLLTTTRPWQKPGSPLELTLEWTASGTLILCGLALLARCVRRVHAPPPPAGDTPDGTPYGVPRARARARVRPWGRPSKGR